MHVQNGSPAKPSVDVREQLRSPFEVFIDDDAAQQRRIDLQDDKIPPSLENAIRGSEHLMGVRRVDKPLALESRRRVLPCL